MSAIFAHVTESKDLVNATEAFTHAPQHYRAESIAQFSKQWQQRWFDAAASGELKTLDFSIRNASGFDVNVKNNDGVTALIVAVKNDQVEFVKALLERDDIDVNFLKPCNGDYCYVLRPSSDNALLLAVDKGDEAMVNALLKHEHIDVNVKNFCGWTPLMWACVKNKLNIVKTLLKKPMINVNAKNDAGNTAAFFAFNGEDPDIFSLLLEREEIIVNIGRRNWSKEDVFQL